MSGEDVDLGVLTTTRRVVEQSRLVRIDQDRLDQLAGELTVAESVIPGWNTEHHYTDGTARTANYVLVLDALNFCFWGEPRWQVERDGQWLDGYWALAYALKRGVLEGIPITDAGYLATLGKADLAYLLRGRGELPLFDERLAILREVGRVLGSRYDGSFTRAIEESQHSAVRLVHTLASEFPSFNDVAVYRGHEVRFFKRAQICAGDLYGAFDGRCWGEFYDLHRLSAFADYKLPQVLRRLGLLRYAPGLARKVDSRVLLPAGSEEEVEIRAATIWGVELLRQALANRGIKVRALELDWYLWHLGQRQAPDDSPYHLTRTIYY